MKKGFAFLLASAVASAAVLDIPPPPSHLPYTVATVAFRKALKPQLRSDATRQIVGFGPYKLVG
jgi:hypothetical protein